MTEVELGFSAFLLLLALGAASGVASVWAFTGLANMAELRVSANRLVAHLLEFHLFSDEPSVVLKAQWGLLVENGRLLRTLAVPLLVLAIPSACFFGAVDAFFGRAPLRPGQGSVVTAQFSSRNGGLLPPTLLAAPNGMAVETSPVRIPAEQQISWRVRPIIASTGDLQFTVNGRIIRKAISSRPGLQWLSDKRRTIDPVLKSISVQYPPAVIFGKPWLLWFGIGSLLGAWLWSVGRVRP